MSEPLALTFGVMARAPVAGHCKTRLARTIGDESAARLYDAMLRDRLDVLCAVDARRVILAAPEDDGVAALEAIAPDGWEVLPQRGADLGERLSNGVAALFELGVRVCLVDSDSPTLPLSSVVAELRALGPKSEIALGPSDDGGYYLIGTTVLEPRLFAKIPWSTERVLAETRSRCAELGLSVHELATWYDVDEHVDLERLVADLALARNIAPRTRTALAALGLR